MPDGTGYFTRAMFGLMNAPFYFSRLMERVLGAYHNKILVLYLYDILIFAKTWDELLQNLK